MCYRLNHSRRLGAADAPLCWDELRLGRVCGYDTTPCTGWHKLVKPWSLGKTLLLRLYTCRHQHSDCMQACTDRHNNQSARIVEPAKKRERAVLCMHTYHTMLTVEGVGWRERLDGTCALCSTVRQRARCIVEMAATPSLSRV